MLPNDANALCHTHHMDFILNSISHHAPWLQPSPYSITWTTIEAILTQHAGLPSHVGEVEDIKTPKYYFFLGGAIPSSSCGCRA